MRRLLMLIICLNLVLCVLLSLVACSNDDGGDTNTSTNTDTSTGTDTSTDTNTNSSEVNVTYEATVKDQDGNAMAGAVLNVYDEDDKLLSTHTANSQGELSFTVVKGVGVKIKIDSDSLPEYHYFGLDYLPLSDETVLAIEIKNNTPNGTIERPYSIEDENELVIPAGQTVYYVLYGGSNRNFALSGANGVSVIFGDETKTIEADGTLEFKIPTIDESSRGTIVTFENTNAQNSTLTLTITSDPGAYDNPFELETGKSNEHVLPKDTTVYYKWVATKTGYFVIHSETSANNITIYNQTTYEVTAPTNGAICDYIWVNENDEIMLYVSSTSKDNYNEVIFEANCYEGTESDPIPLYQADVMLSFAKEQALTFVLKNKEACSLEIINDYAKLTIDGEDKEPDINGLIGDISVDATEKLIVVTNTDTRDEQEILISLYVAIKE